MKILRIMILFVTSQIINTLNNAVKERWRNSTYIIDGIIDPSRNRPQKKDPLYREMSQPCPIFWPQTTPCANGDCVNGTCQCNKGWEGFSLLNDMRGVACPYPITGLLIARVVVLCAGLALLFSAGLRFYLSSIKASKVRSAQELDRLHNISRTSINDVRKSRNGSRTADAEEGTVARAPIPATTGNMTSTGGNAKVSTIRRRSTGISPKVKRSSVVINWKFVILIGRLFFALFVILLFTTLISYDYLEDQISVEVAKLFCLTLLSLATFLYYGIVPAAVYKLYKVSYYSQRMITERPGAAIPRPILIVRSFLVVIVILTYAASAILLIFAVMAYAGFFNDATVMSRLAIRMYWIGVSLAILFDYSKQLYEIFSILTMFRDVLSRRSSDEAVMKKAKTIIDDVSKAKWIMMVVGLAPLTYLTVSLIPFLANGLEFTLYLCIILMCGFLGTLVV